MPEEEKPKNLHQRMQEIAKEAAKIPKNGKNNFSNYSYVKAVDVINHIQKLLYKHGVNLSIREDEFSRTQIGKMNHSTIKSVAVFTNVDNTEQIMVVPYYGVASDSLDKDIYKAKTGGLKYLFTQQFLLVTDDVVDPEDDRAEKAHAKEKAKRPEPVRATPTPTIMPEKLLKELWTCAQAKGLTTGTVVGLMKNRYGVDSMRKLTPENYEDFLKYLDGREGKTYV